MIIAYSFFLHMYALRVSVVNKEATYLLIVRWHRSTILHWPSSLWTEI